MIHKTVQSKEGVFSFLSDNDSLADNAEECSFGVICDSVSINKQMTQCLLKTLTTPNIRHVGSNCVYV